MTVLVVDPSAVVALLKSEPGWEALATRLHAAASRVLSVAGWLELSLVVAGRHGDEATLEFLDRFLRAAAIELHPVDEPQARLAREAFLRFGKGRHPAGSPPISLSQTLISEHFSGFPVKQNQAVDITLWRENLSIFKTDRW